MKSGKEEIKRIIHAFVYSYNGFKTVLKAETAFRQEIAFCLLCGVSFFFLPFSAVETAVLSFSLFFILFAELVNTAIETIIDRIGEEYNTLSEKAKDIGSFLVLLSFVNFFIISGIILFFLLQRN